MIRYKTEEEIDVLREGGKVHSRILKELSRKVAPLVKTSDLNDYAEMLIDQAGATPAFLGYKPRGAKRPYPASLCVSINEEIVHGIPNEGGRVLEEGDIVTLDLGLSYFREGDPSIKMITDSAITVAVGKISPEKQKLIKATEDALFAGIKSMKLGGNVGDIGAGIMEVANRAGFSIVEGLCGHGVGYSVHEEPFVPNEAMRGTGPELLPGLVIAIEPMLSLGSPKIKLMDDGYTYVTRDKSVSAHFEHTVVVTKSGIEIVTK
jgi:methionyl aminopeptidase